MRTALLTASLVVLAGSATALYEDQAGSIDWYRPYVGHVVSAALHRTKPRLYFGTEQGVAGALNLRDGTIAFRHLLADGAGPAAVTTALLEAPLNVLVSLGASGSLQGWDTADGALKWAIAMHAPPKPGPTHAPLLVVAPGASPQIAVLSQTALLTFDAGTGARARSVTLSGSAAGATLGLLHASSSTAVTAYTFTPGEVSVHVITSEGEPVELTASHPLSDIAAAGPAGFVALSQDYASVCAAGPGATALQCTLLSQPGSRTSQLVATAKGWALASGNPDSPGALLLKLTEDGGSVEVAAKFDAPSAVSAPFAAAAGEVVALVEVAADGSLSLQYVSTESGAVLVSEGPIKGGRTERLAPGVASLGVRAATIGSFKKRDQSEGFRLLVVWQDERVALLQQGVTVWSRDEALGGVAASLFSDLPPGKVAAVGDGSETGTAADLKTQLSQFVELQLLSAKVQFKVATDDEVAELTKLRAQYSDKQLPTRDARGFRRSLVVATSSGKLAALHNGDGHLIWSRPGPAGRKGANVAPQHLLQWRTYHDLTHAPQVAVLADRDGATWLSVLNAYTGEQVEHTQLPYKLHKLVPLGSVSDGEHADQHIHLAVTLEGPSGNPRVHLLPDTTSARSYFARKHRSLFFFLDAPSTLDASTPTTSFRGYGFDSKAGAALDAGGVITPLPTWTLELPEPVLAWKAADPHEPLHTSVKVLGDRSMKYRYLNPNSLVVVTGIPPGSSAEVDPLDAEAIIYVVDTVTGAVRAAQTAPSCRGPAALLVTENLVLVQLWDAGASRFSITSLELYDASERQFSVLDHMFNPNATAPQSSFNPPPLEVLTSAFFTRTPAKALAVTRTRAGINSKLLIGLTHTDQVYALDMRFVDPRRPRRAKLTAEETEERLIPYQDTLPLMPIMFASFNKQVMGLKAAVSAPSRLESNSLLFTYGIDLQYTRLAPAKGFDSLDDDFSYGLLVVALVGLTAASAFMHVYTKNSMLKAKWK